jgi:hypothetical protein
MAPSDKRRIICVYDVYNHIYYVYDMHVYDICDHISYTCMTSVMYIILSYILCNNNYNIAAPASMAPSDAATETKNEGGDFGHAAGVNGEERGCGAVVAGAAGGECLRFWV